jgi:hypothetical protein
MAELKYEREVYTITAADAAGTWYIQRNYTPVGIKHGIDKSPGGCDRPQRWLVHNAQVTICDANLQMLLGTVCKIGALHPNGTSFVERQKSTGSAGQSTQAETPFLTEAGIGWQIHKSLLTAGQLVVFLASYEVVN